MQIDLDEWTKIQTEFSQKTNLPITLLDPSGNILIETGNKLPYTKLVLSQKMTYDLAKNCDQEHMEEARLTKQMIQYCTVTSMEKIMFPVFQNQKILGYLTTEFAKKSNSEKFKDLSFLSGISEIELKAAYNESYIKLKSEDIQIYLSLIASIAPNMSKEKKEITEELSKLNIVQKFTKAITGIKDLTILTNRVGRCMESALKSTSASLITYNKNRINNIYHSEAELSKELLEVNLELAKEALESKTGEFISNTANDLRLTNCLKKPKSILSIPLIQEKNIIGLFLFHGNYMKSLTQEDFEYISIIADYLSVSVNNAINILEIERLSITDSLTKLFNRRAFNTTLNKEIERALRTNEPLSVLIIDIDHFKNYNDANGHQQGDELLKLLGSLIQNSLRATDFAARYGGEEFVFVLPNTDIKGAEIVAEKLRLEVEQKEFKGADTQPLGFLSISIGVASFRKPDTFESLMKRVDERLYYAKEHGRNKWVSNQIYENTKKY